MSETTKVQHTPGPWAVEFGVAAGVYVSRETAAGDVQMIATALRDGLPDLEPPSNACLIAAAPELLEALHGLMDIESRGRTMPVGPEWDAARAAIAKAEGR